MCSRYASLSRILELCLTCFSSDFQQTFCRELSFFLNNIFIKVSIAYQTVSIVQTFKFLTHMYLYRPSYSHTFTQTLKLETHIH